MEFALLIYLGSVLNAVSTLAGILFFAAIVGSVVFVVVATLEEVWENKRVVRTFRRLLQGNALLAAMIVFIPSESTYNAMLVAYGAQYVATAEETQELGGKSLKAINKLLDEYLEDGE